MFRDNAVLTTIWAAPKADWTNISAVNTGTMYSNCTSLAGGNGTAYDASSVGLSMSRVDGLNGKRGYFTAKQYRDGEILSLGTWLDKRIEPVHVNLGVDKTFKFKAGNSTPEILSIAEDEFTFELRKDSLTGDLLQTVKTPATSSKPFVSASFDNLVFGPEDVGTHEYWITETQNNDSHISDDGDGTWKAEITINLTSDTITGKKILTYTKNLTQV